MTEGNNGVDRWRACIPSVLDPSGDVILLLNRKRPASQARSASRRKNDDGPTPISVRSRRTCNADPEPELDDLEVQVSSRHLMLASRVFRIMFSGLYKERLSLDGPPLRLPLPDDDAVALGVILSIIHKKHKLVPQCFTPSTPRNIAMLKNVAMLIDKYDMFDACQIYYDIWLDSVRFRHLELVDQVYLAWVFRRPIQFREATRRIVFEKSSGFKHSLIPDFILGQSSQRHGVEPVLRFIAR
jgi:hypothetical protein